jgi:hypothetical protein
MEILRFAFWLILSTIFYAYIGHGLIFGILARLKNPKK